MSKTGAASPKTLVIVDDHEAVMESTVKALQQVYPETKVVKARTTQEAAVLIEQTRPEMVIMDLSLPAEPKETPQIETGIQLLRMLLDRYPRVNFTVQSGHVRSLVRLKPAIEIHQAGFTIVDKGLPIQEMLTKVDWSLQGIVYTPPEMRAKLEIKPEWLTVLALAFREGLTDKAIAEQMHVAERTVRHYWTRLQDALGVYPESGKNIRIQTEIRARQEGLLD